MSNVSNAGKGLDLKALRLSDPFAAANIDKFLKEQERKRAFLDEMRTKLPPGVWGQLGQQITDAVIKADGSKLDQVFQEITQSVANFMKAGGAGAAGRMGLDALLNAESSPVLAALEQVEKFLGNASPRPEQEA